MKLRISKWMVAPGLLLSLLALAACGGGGGGDGGGSVPAAYSGGATTQASITTDNAQTLAAGAWEGGNTSTEVGGVVPLQTGEGASASALPDLVQMAKVLKAPVERLNLGATPSVTPASTDSNTLYDGYGGSASYSISANDSTGAFSGTFQFNGYNSGGVTVDGGMNISGKIDLATDNLTQLKLSFSSLTVSDTTQSFTLDGSIAGSMSTDGTEETDTFNLILIDSTAHKSYWIRNYVITTTFGADSDQVTVSGRYYDFVNGYVDITTLTPLTIPSTATQPTAGALLFTGKDNSQARLSFNSTGSTLDVDADGDGTFEATITNPI